MKNKTWPGKNIKITAVANKASKKHFFGPVAINDSIVTFALYFYVLSWLLKQEVEEECFSAEQE